MKRLYFEPYMHSSSGGKDEETCVICRKPSPGYYRALVASKKSAESIKEMFGNLELFVSIVPHDPKAPDIKISGCRDHYLNVSQFVRRHEKTKRVTYRSIADSLIR